MERQEPPLAQSIKNSQNLVERSEGWLFACKWDESLLFGIQDFSSTPSDSAREELEDDITPEEVDEQEYSVAKVDPSMCPSVWPAEKRTREFSDDGPNHCDMEILTPTAFASCYQSSKQRKVVKLYGEIYNKSALPLSYLGS